MKWSWNTKKWAYWNNGLFNTKEEAIQDAMNKGNKHFYVGEMDLAPLPTRVSVESILEELDGSYFEETSCEDYIYEEVNEEDKKWLENEFSKLIKEFHKRTNTTSKCYTNISAELINKIE